jgi:hypothetical protein
MRKTEPLTQLMCRFVWGCTVKGHDCSWHAWQSSDLGTPAIINWRNFNLVSLVTYSVLKAMNRHMKPLRSQRLYLAIIRNKNLRSSEGQHEYFLHSLGLRTSSDKRFRNLFTLSESPQVLH